MIDNSIVGAMMIVLLNVDSSPAVVKREVYTNAGYHSTKLMFVSGPGKLRSHSHQLDHDHGTNSDSTKALPQNPHANNTSVPSAELLSRLLMFWKAQFDTDNVPTITTSTTDANGVVTKYQDDDFSPNEKTELARLHGVGIPVLRLR